MCIVCLEATMLGCSCFCCYYIKINGKISHLFINQAALFETYWQPNVGILLVYTDQAVEAFMYMLHGEYVVLLADQSPGKIVV